MEKTKTVALIVILAAISAIVIAGTAYAQTTSAPTSTPTTGPYGQGPQNNGYTGTNGYCGGQCPMVNGYGCDPAQNGYPTSAGYGRCGMMGGCR